MGLRSARIAAIGINFHSRQICRTIIDALFGGDQAGAMNFVVGERGEKMIELKPCPFCGGTDLHLEFFSGCEADAIVCYDCLATFSQQEITCEEDLIKAWNRRADDETPNT